MLPAWVGIKVLHKMFNRKVVLHSDGTVMKSGKRIVVGEADALKVAARAGISAPQVLDTVSTSDGHSIRMSYIPGQSLDTLWLDMTVAEKRELAQQLRAIIQQMRSIAPPGNFIGACDGAEIRDTRLQFTYHSPPCRNEEALNDYLSAALQGHTPPLVKEALVRRLRTDHRIVFSNCDLAPGNIIVQDGKIHGLVDWEDSGWYPEYWEYVKFFQRPADKDWKLYAGDIFPELYHDELVNFIAMSRFQNT